MALRAPRKPRNPKPAADPRAELVRALINADEVVSSACGVCGATVADDDPEAVQTESVRWLGLARVSRRAWRFHRVCKVASERGPAAILALMLDPYARPVRVTQAIADVARRIGVPLTYEEIEGTRAIDAGKRGQMFYRVSRGDLNERRAAVARRELELTVPVPHSSGFPCQVCGRSHDLTDAWADHRGRPVCGTCSTLVKRSMIPGNRRLEQYAEQAAAPHLHRRARFALARDAADYRPLLADERRAPWAYCGGLPLAPLSGEEQMAARVAELESRLAEATV